jgi:hypothetical protein
MSKKGVKKRIKELEKRVKGLEKAKEKEIEQDPNSVYRKILPFFSDNDDGDVEINISLKRRKVKENDS